MTSPEPTPPRSLTGCILTETGWIDGTLHCGDRITAIEGETVETPAAPYILPGFVDLHVHGGGGHDMMTGAGAIRGAAALHARHGTTAMLPTSVTAPTADLSAFLSAVAACMDRPDPGVARILGAHLEGPVINPHKLGAQPPHTAPPDPDQLRAWAAMAPIRVMTFAPEMDPGHALEDTMHALDIRAQLGHSLCDYATARGALARGCGVTHLFNAMSPLSHRDNGLAGAALAHADHAEIIPDLIHVEPGAILAARRAIPHLHGVTDATAGAGMPDGPYQLGRHAVTKARGAMRLDDGTLAGSALTMDVALRNLVGLGLPLAEAARRLSTLPADWLGEAEIGRLTPGAQADVLHFDRDLALVDVMIGGQSLPPEET
ncbi:N-acetylglucosamine-6-phosphate deacetylase [Salibaculum halophilum]|uniref:N-acetylglucosamine-6-phosphate deacetylase n=1 Tax=Salibaculum halophilum TaxID=1914408 RepID=UPI000A10DAE0|nr:amidohydrolase family protein [Salibaculum halophilum]